jgi:hypothetical protein
MKESHSRHAADADTFRADAFKDGCRITSSLGAKVISNSHTRAIFFAFIIRIKQIVRKLGVISFIKGTTIEIATTD